MCWWISATIIAGMLLAVINLYDHQKPEPFRGHPLEDAFTILSLGADAFTRMLLSGVVIFAYLIFWIIYLVCTR
jgi:hypothetical protein